MIDEKYADVLWALLDHYREEGCGMSLNDVGNVTGLRPREVADEMKKLICDRLIESLNTTKWHPTKRAIKMFERRSI